MGLLVECMRDVRDAKVGQLYVGFEAESWTALCRSCFWATLKNGGGFGRLNIELLGREDQASVTPKPR